MFDTEIDFVSEKALVGQEMIKFIERVANNHVAQMKEHMMTSNSEAEMIFQIITSDLNTIIFPPGIAKMQQDVALNFAKNLASKTSAVAVIGVAESWSLLGLKKKEMELEIAKYGFVRNHPDRVESFSVVASYNVKGTSKSYVYIAPIINHDNGTRSLNEEDALKETFDDMESLMTVPAEFLMPIEV